ncbi:MAG: 3'(2'),5'-bisphosphate nucleotidase CysQ [Magnetospirillum sp.]|nr:3'(2'),5'-bisphosphate nucleotidase CysQ [Magnetospirillum sp.]
MTLEQPLSLLPALEDLARRAGSVILDVYHADFSVERKRDDSPVTEADRQAEAVILAGLASLTPGIPVVAEEEVAAGRIPDVENRPFWLVDPLDGTKEFVKRNGEFTVNIGLIVGDVPVAGVVLAPALGQMWSAAGPGTAAAVEADGSRRPIACRRPPATSAVVLTSRSHNEPDALRAWMAPLAEPVLEFSGSSLKFCRVAEGSADYYPRFGPTNEWDVAAAHAVLLAAGGELVTFDGAPLGYRKPRFRNPDYLARARG